MFAPGRFRGVESVLELRRRRDILAAGLQNDVAGGHAEARRFAARLNAQDGHALAAFALHIASGCQLQAEPIVLCVAVPVPRCDRHCLLHPAYFDPDIFGLAAAFDRERYLRAGGDPRNLAGKCPRVLDALVTGRRDDVSRLRRPRRRGYQAAAP